VGEVVVKTHPAGTDPAALACRLRTAARLGRGGGPLLAPLSPRPLPAPGRRWRSRWPRLEMVGQDWPDFPWASAGALLAELHRSPVGTDPLPAHRGVERIRVALETLPAHAPAVIRRAAEELPPRCWQASPEGRPVTLVHGDFHLGQLGRNRAGAWRLIDIDDLGVGDPAWDLCRIAGFWAAGLMPHADWHAFISGYRAANGPAVPPTGDPWQVLDPVARAAVVHAAAVGARYAPDESQAELLAACARVAG
jgi:aminoglycoside phosphotransferase (APT) family kinase protein